MSIDRRTLLGGATAGLALAAAPARAAVTAQDKPLPPIAWPPAEHFRLWPGAAPGAPTKLPTPKQERNGYQGAELWLRGIVDPIVAVYRPEKPDGRAVLSIPGGGYGFVSASNEGIDVAAALNPHGITVFVLAYRLPGDGWANRADVPLQDAQRAMRLIRARAATWGIDPEKLGILGFSAGGHLGASLAVGHGDKVYAPVDAADTLSARPAYAALVYPVVSFRSAGLNSRSAEMLLGPDPDAATADRYETADRVTAEMPPVFLVQAINDGTVPYAQSVLMMERCVAAKVPVESHFFEEGGHGFGAFHAREGSSTRQWPALFDAWSKRQ